MPAPAQPSPSATLLRIVRTLIEIGRQRLAAVRSQPDPEETHDLACAFGTFNIAVILARILRGLRIAAALEGRVIAAAPKIDNRRIDTPRPDRAATTARSPRPARKAKLSDAEDNAALLARVPTDREIAEMVRGRPIGAVLNDICADLGIGVDHPLWQELRWVIIEYDGQPETVMMRSFQRIFDAHREMAEGLAPHPDFYAKTERIQYVSSPPPLILAA